MVKFKINLKKITALFLIAICFYGCGTNPNLIKDSGTITSYEEKNGIFSKDVTIVLDNSRIHSFEVSLITGDYDYKNLKKGNKCAIAYMYRGGFGSLLISLALLQ